MSGKQKWAFPIRSSGPLSPPQPEVANDLLYIYSGFENGISLYALDTATGVQKWRVQTADAVSSSYLPPPPIVAGGIVYTSANSTTLYALDALSGKVRWTFQNGEYGFVSTVAEGVVYTTNVSTTYALDAVSGAKIWTFQNSSPGGPIVANGTVYISGRNLYALDAATGNEKWSFSRLGPDILRVVNSTVYTFYNKILYALDAITGREKWHFWQASDTCSSPVVDKGIVYIGSGDGHLYALDETSGGQKWAMLIEVSQAGQPAAPIVNHGMIYLSDSTNLQVLDMSGKQKWSFTLGIADSIIQPASPAIANGLIYVNGGTNVDGSLGTKLYELTLPERKLS